VRPGPGPGRQSVVTVQTADPDSLRYARYWEPVLAAPASRMLARIEAEPSTFLDVGAGTGSLLLAAAARWPAARIVALDGSAGMLSVARLRIAEAWPEQGGRFEWLVAEASSMPLVDRSIDVASVAFVLELVDDRRALLREVARVLRPGGVLGLVSTMAHELVSGADQAFAVLVDEWGLATGTAGLRPSRGSEYESLEEAEAELAEAGFVSIDVRSDQLQHAWTAMQYLRFMEQYDERDVFESLDAAARRRFRRALRHRWSTLPAAAFELRGPVLQALARRPER
jgi:ubiquinone/menaquinone biosynthesis C-methylase UbiE